MPPGLQRQAADRVRSLGFPRPTPWLSQRATTLWREAWTFARNLGPIHNKIVKPARLDLSAWASKRLVPSPGLFQDRVATCW